MKRLTQVTIMLAMITLGSRAGQISTSVPNPLTTLYTVDAGDYFEPGVGGVFAGGTTALDIDSGGTLEILDPRYQTIIQQNTAGTATININTGGAMDFSNASGNGTGLWLGNNVATATGIIHLNGGTFDGSGLTDIIFGRDGALGEFKVSAGTATFGSTPAFQNGSIDFSANSTGILAIDGGSQFYFEQLFSAGNLTHAGSNTGNFSDHFHASGEYVALIGVTLPDPPQPPVVVLEPSTLWYQSPAVNWETHALPIGNGSAGAMLFGDPAAMVANFNEDSLWLGNETDTGMYQSFGSLRFAMDGMDGATGYSRQLSLIDALHKVNYTVGSTNFQREAFASYPDSAIIIRCTADQPGGYTGTISVADDHGQQTTVIGNDQLQITGSLNNGMKYAASVKVIVEGGTLTTNANTLSVAQANTVLFILAADTDYVADYSLSWHGPEPLPIVEHRITAAATQSFDTLKARHIADYQPLYQRNRIDLGASAPALAQLSTEARLLNFWQTKDDPDFEELVFQYGRYLLIASSRPGGLPPNLQGLWNPMNKPPWRSDYHSDINLDMNYWLCEVTNLSELHQPFFDHVKGMIPAWENRTLNDSGHPGWSIWFETGIHGGGTWNWNPAGNAWFAQQFWTHYAFTQDKTFLLEEALPVFRGVCEFWEDRLIAATNGAGLVAPNGFSPEYGPREDGVTYDQQLIWDAFSNYIEACEILGVESNYAATIRGLRAQLAPLKIGSWGQLQEWLMADRDKNPEAHRHLSHLIAVYPGRQIIPGANGDPALADAAKVSLIARGDGGAGWALPWKAALWSRYGDGDHARTLLVNKLKPVLTTSGNYNSGSNGTSPNLLTVVWDRYQIDGTFGYTGALAEMLLQSHGDVIDLLPALPAAWPSGSFTGLRARGGFEVDMAWTNGALSLATIDSNAGGIIDVRYDGKAISLSTQVGQSYTLYPSDFTTSNLTNSIVPSVVAAGGPNRRGVAHSDYPRCWQSTRQWCDRYRNL